MGAIFKIWNSYISPATNALLDLGSLALKWKDLYVDGIGYMDAIIMSGDIDCTDYSIKSIAYLYGASDNDYLALGSTGRLIINMTGSGTPFATPDIDITGSVYFDDDIGLLLDKKILFGDIAVSVSSQDDGHLDLEADVSIDLNGAVTISKSTPTDTYVVLATDHLVLCNKTSAFNVTLPAASGSGRELIIKNINTGVATICGNGADTIDGSNTFALNNQYDGVTIIDAAANVWYITNFISQIAFT